MTSELKETLATLRNTSTPSAPQLFSMLNETDCKEIARLVETKAIQRVVDDYEEQERELFGVKNPTLVYAPGFEETFQKHYDALREKGLETEGAWAYFAWSNTLTHILPESDFFTVRTARNKNLITKEEQDLYYRATIGIAGLSVGSSVAFALVLQGGAKHIKLADMDRLALSNTNRVLSGTHELGSLKVEMAARRIYEINPYATIELFPDGLQPENIDRFFEGLNIIIDEIDNLAVKYLIRERAMKLGIAVVMAADNGDNAVVDVERYDLNRDTPFFHGRMGEVTYEMLNSLDKFGIGKMITKLVGPENVTVRMQQSLLEMGKTIVSWPQLGGAALINGAAVAYCVRKILNKEPLEDSRALISLDEKLVPNYDGEESVNSRATATESFKKIFGL
jgi:hypothetical protein